jgi:hypothetical protein
MRRTAVSENLVDTSTIRGWGADANSDNDPTFPIRHREDRDTRGLAWTRPTLQDSDVEILQSIEHNRRPAVIGTSTPPSGISGMIRRYAFRRSESDWLHWLLLMGADRLNVVEGVIEDLGKGYVPNIPAEMGARAEWKHNKKGFVTKAAVVAGLTTVTILVFRSRRFKDQAKSGDADMLALSAPETFS